MPAPKLKYMYYESSQYERKSFFKRIFSFILTILLCIFIIIAIQYFSPHNEDETYYFQFKKIPQGDYNTLHSLASSQQKNIFSLHNTHSLYTLSSTLPITISDSVKESEISYLQKDSHRTVLPLSADCVVSSISVLQQTYGVVLGCSNGRIKIITVETEKEKESLLYQSMDIQAPILMVTWQQKDIIVFALGSKEALSPKDNSSSVDKKNSVTIYRLSRDSTIFQQKSTLFDALTLDYINTIYSIEDVGIYINTAKGIELVSNDKVNSIFNEAILQFAGGSKDFHVLQFQKEKKQYLTLNIGANIAFTLFENTDNRENVNIYYDKQDTRFIVRSKNNNNSNHYAIYYTMVLKHE